MHENENIRLCLLQSLDSQWTQHAHVLLFSDPRVEPVPPEDADYIVLHGSTPEPLRMWRNTKFVMLNLGDLYGAKIGLRAEDEYYRHMARTNNNTFIYLECEVEPQGRKLYQDDNFIILTMPIGYIAGSKINVHYPDYDESAWHVKNIFKNPKNYKYDWCWIATISSKERDEVTKILEKRNTGYLNVSLPSKERNKVKRMKEIHADNKAVPYDEFMKIHRESKVAISCNGMGMWCYKDAEMLARNVFVLRQYHRNLDLNPLSPVDGKHWVVFKNDELEEKLDYYIRNDEERERINDAGHEYFKEGLLGGWAKHYVDALIEYKHTENPNAFGELRYGMHPR